MLVKGAIGTDTKLSFYRGTLCRGLSNNYTLFQTIVFASCGMETVHNCAFYTTSVAYQSKLTEAPWLHLLKTSLTFLSLFQNQFFYLPLDYFSGFKKLESLNLSWNKLISFPNIDYASLQTSLYSVRLDYNNIKRINLFRPKTRFRSIF